MSQTADHAQQIVQQALSRFEQLAASDEAPTQVLTQLLSTVTQATAALGGVIWMTSGPGAGFRAVTRHGHAAALAVAPDGSAPPSAAAVLAQSSEQRKPIVVAPDSPEFNGTELRNTAQFFVPIEAMGKALGVTQVIAPANLDPKVYRQYAAFVQQSARAAGAYLARRQSQVLSEDAAGHAAILQTLHRLLQIDTPANLIHETASLAAPLLDAQRISIVSYWRRKGDVAFSNTIDVNRRAVLCRAVEMLGDVARQRSAPMSFVKGRKLEDEDAGIEPLLDQVYDLGSAAALCVTPIRSAGRNDTIVGVMVAEYADPAVASRKAPVQQELCRQVGPVLDHCAESHRRPLRRTSNLISSVRRHPLSSTARTLLAVGAITAVVYGLFFVPVDIIVRGNARLEPAHLAQITAPVDGRVKAVLITAGQPVKAGDVLLEIDDQDLRLALNEVNKSIEEQQAIYDSARDRARNDDRALAELGQIQLKIQGLRVQKERLLKRLEDTRVRSPIDGVVLTENADHLLHMTVTKGAMMLRVADLGQFELVAELREEDLALVDEALRAGRPVPVGFLAHAWPQRPQTATLDNLQSLAPTSSPDEYQRQHVFKVTMPIELEGVSEQLALANPTGRAKLTTGKGSIAYRYARGVWRFIQMTLLF